MLVQKFISLNFFLPSLFLVFFWCFSLHTVASHSLYLRSPSLHVFKRAASRYSKFVCTTLCRRLLSALPPSHSLPIYLFTQIHHSHCSRSLASEWYVIRFAWHTHLLYHQQQQQQQKKYFGRLALSVWWHNFMNEKLVNKEFFMYFVIGVDDSSFSSLAALPLPFFPLTLSLSLTLPPPVWDEEVNFCPCNYYLCMYASLRSLVSLFVVIFICQRSERER